MKCHYELRTKNNVPGIPKDIFCCNPKYRGKSWFDWMMVTYSRAGSGDVLNAFVTPARIFLWMAYKINVYAPIDIVALIRALNSYDTPQYSMMKAWNVDKYHSNYSVVNFFSVKSVAYVLPAACSEESLERLAPGGIICDHEDMNEYFVSIPSQSEWLYIGWD